MFSDASHAPACRQHKCSSNGTTRLRLHKRYPSAIADFGAHTQPQRAHHAVDSATQRWVIACLVWAIAMGYADWTADCNPLIAALPDIAAVYVAITCIYRRLIPLRPNALVAAHCGLILADPARTVLALAAMPTLMGPLSAMLLVQIGPCGIRSSWLTVRCTPPSAPARPGSCCLPVSSAAGGHCWPSGSPHTTR